ncbi:UNVERIFIED_CONTAM: hypothetical protein HDU68_000290 [Siphonaria sp. JEL0065]|nr:hypothetical protein HDU68_000290 [Siphonaria sp. JEL0065]
MTYQSLLYGSTFSPTCDTSIGYIDHHVSTSNCSSAACETDIFHFPYANKAQCTQDWQTYGRRLFKAANQSFVEMTYFDDAKCTQKPVPSFNNNGSRIGEQYAIGVCYGHGGIPLLPPSYYKLTITADGNVTLGEYDHADCSGVPSVNSLYVTKLGCTTIGLNVKDYVQTLLNPEAPPLPAPSTQANSSTTPDSGGSSSNTPAIIGGGIAALLVIAVIIRFAFLKKSEKIATETAKFGTLSLPANPSVWTSHQAAKWAENNDASEDVLLYITSNNIDGRQLLALDVDQQGLQFSSKGSRGRFVQALDGLKGIHADSVVAST